MILKIINSNSKGNAYLLGNEQSACLIECGVKFDQIKQAADFNTMKIDVCTVTHEHKDHSKSIKQVQQSGIPVIASRGTFKGCDIGSEAMDIIIAYGQRKTVKDWKIAAFTVEHDAAEPLGYVIEHNDCGKVLFVTDTFVLKHKFPFKFDHIIIEANYCEELAEEWKKTKGNDFVEGRRLTNHMSFQTALLTLERMDLSRCKNIVLIHLSDGLTDEKRFKEQTEARFGIPTTVAAPGVEVNFNLNPY